MRTTARFAAVFAAAALLAPVAVLADSDISAAGSTALQPLVAAAAGEYQAKHPATKISVTGGGSRTGLGLVSSKAVDVGDSDIPADNQPGLIDHRVAVIGFAIVTNPDAKVRNLSKAQIADIFTGKVKNWKQLGGSDEAITVINRPASSGTRAVFVKTLMGKAALDQNTLTEDATGTVVQKVKQTPGSISYAAFSGVHNQSGLSEIAIGGVAPNAANVQRGKYPFWSYEHMYTNGQPSKDVADFINFVKGDKSLLQRTGYIAVPDMKVSANDR